MRRSWPIFHGWGRSLCGLGGRGVFFGDGRVRASVVGASRSSQRVEERQHLFLEAPSAIARERRRGSDAARGVVGFCSQILFGRARVWCRDPRKEITLVADVGGSMQSGPLVRPSVVGGARPGLEENNEVRGHAAGGERAQAAQVAGGQSKAGTTLVARIAPVDRSIRGRRLFEDCAGSGTSLLV